jgi:hypothetical protein
MRIMSAPEEEPYSAIFASLKHPVRRKILRMLSEKPRSFTEMLEASEVSSSHLTYHLENLGELVSKTDDGKYKLSVFGQAAVATMNKVEETPKATNPNRISSLPIEWKSLLAVLTIGIVILAGLSYTQYRSLNETSGQYGALQQALDLVTEGALLQTEYTLRYGFYILSNSTANLTAMNGWNVSLLLDNASKLNILIDGPSSCAIYTPYDGCTLDFFLFVHSIPSGSYVTPTVQNGNVYSLGANETAPAIWTLNATATGEYSIPLASKGWYTVSLAGPMGPITYPLAFKLLEGDCSASLIMMHEGKVSPFIVTESALP